MTEIHPGYVNHIGSTRDGAGNLFAVITQDGPGSGDTHVIVKKCAASADPAAAASWIEVARWTEQVDGKPGYGTAEVRASDGLFVAILSQRNAAGQTVVMVRTVAGIASPAPVTTAVDQAARDQANYATSLATTAKARSDAAVTQANAATQMAHSAINQNVVQDEQIAALDGRVTTLEGV